MPFALLIVNWPNVFLVCFIVGFVLSLFSLLMGLFHMHIDVPEHMAHFLHFSHVHTHLPHVHVDGAHGGVDKGMVDISPVNFSTIMAFLAWFGGTGYLLTSVYGYWYLAALGVASLAGLAGATFIFWFMVKFLLRHEQPMDPTEFRIVGAVGTLTLGIREGGTGELVYVQGGARKTAAARSENGLPIPKGTEVAVTSFERGVAYVRRWDELAGDSAAAGDTGSDR